MEPAIFISHEWSDDDAYQRAVKLLNDALPAGWTNLSIPRSKAIRHSEQKRDLWQSRISAAAEESRATERRLERLARDRAYLTELQTGHDPDISIKEALHRARQDLDSLTSEMPNRFALSRYVEEPLSQLAEKEAHFSSSGLLEKSLREVASKIEEDFERAKTNLAELATREERLRADFNRDDVTVSIDFPYVYSADVFPKSVPGSRAIDSVLAETLSSLVARADLFILLINTYGLERGWIYFELALCLRHRCRVIAIPQEKESRLGRGLERDLTRFGATIMSWSHLSNAVVDLAGQYSQRAKPL